MRFRCLYCEHLNEDSLIILVEKIQPNDTSFGNIRFVRIIGGGDGGGFMESGIMFT